MKYPFRGRQPGLLNFPQDLQPQRHLRPQEVYHLHPHCQPGHRQNCLCNDLAKLPETEILEESMPISASIGPA